MSNKYAFYLLRTDNYCSIDFVREYRFGKVDEAKSTEEKERICFKNYFKDKNQTYFIIVEYYPEFIKIVTVFKKKGKY